MLTAEYRSLPKLPTVVDMFYYTREGSEMEEEQLYLQAIAIAQIVRRCRAAE